MQLAGLSIAGECVRLSVILGKNANTDKFVEAAVLKPPPLVDWSGSRLLSQLLALFVGRVRKGPRDR